MKSVCYLEKIIKYENENCYLAKIIKNEYPSIVYFVLFGQQQNMKYVQKNLF